MATNFETPMDTMSRQGSITQISDDWNPKQILELQALKNYYLKMADHIDLILKDGPGSSIQPTKPDPSTISAILHSKKSPEKNPYEELNKKLLDSQGEVNEAGAIDWGTIMAQSPEVLTDQLAIIEKKLH